MAITAQQVKELRDRTGLPMMECKRALESSGGDIDGAKDILRKRGLKVAEKKSGRETAQGVVAGYIHHNDRVGVMVEVNCETDFVARNEDFRGFVKDLCLHIAFAGPLCLRREELPPELVERERDIVGEQLKKVPEQKRAQAIEGRLRKTFYAAKVLLDQPFVKDDSRTVEAVLKELIAKLRENVVIRRFRRFELGE